MTYTVKQSCRPTLYVPAHSIVDNIRHACLPFGSITTFKAYVEKADVLLGGSSNTYQLSLLEQLGLFGVSLCYYPPAMRSSVGERLLLVDMLLFALDNPAPYTVIILITGHEISPYAISALRLRHYKVVLITPQNSGGPIRPSMASQANQVLDWATVMSRGRNSPAVGSQSSPSSVASLVSVDSKNTTKFPPNTGAGSGHVVTSPQSYSSHLRQFSTSSTSSALPRSSFQTATPLFPAQNSGIPPTSTLQPFRASRTQSGPTRTWTNSLFSTGTIKTPPIFGSGFQASPFKQLQQQPQQQQQPQHQQQQQQQQQYHHQTSHVVSPIPSTPPSAVTATSNWMQGNYQSGHSGALGIPLSPTYSVRHSHTGHFSQAELNAPSTPIFYQHPHTGQLVTPPKSALQVTQLPLQLAQQQQQQQQEPQHTSHHSSSSQQGQQIMQASHGFSQQVINPAMLNVRNFDVLINILREFRNEGKPRPYRSKIGSELVQRDRSVYARAGVAGFKEYVGQAEQLGLVRLGGHTQSPGKEWIELVSDPT